MISPFPRCQALGLVGAKKLNMHSFSFTRISYIGATKAKGCPLLNKNPDIMDVLEVALLRISFITRSSEMSVATKINNHLMPIDLFRSYII